jgi:hypothetical protein
MRRVLAALVLGLAVVALGGCSLTSKEEKKKSETQQGGQQGKGVVVVNLDGSDANKTPDHTLTVPKIAVKQQARQNEDTGGKDETPPGVPKADIEAGQEQQKRLALKDLLPLNLPFAAPSTPGCRSNFVANHSSRNGVAPHVIFMHWTGSANTKGWGDVNAITAWFNQARSQASSNYIVDAEGKCNYIVREADKSWTQAALNPVGISFEIVHPGGPNEPYCPGACRRKVAHVIAGISKRWKIPLQRAIVRDCRVIRPGITDHRAGGACAGGHPDVSSAGFSVDPIIQLARKYAGQVKHRYKPTATDRVTCRKLNFWRTHGRHHGKAERNAVRRKKALARRGVVCTRRGPLRTR